jgi:PRONE (Plant-specific Rop nucleotide exchanger)
LESYSRVLESLASTVLSRVEDVIRADDVAKSVNSKKHPPSHDSEPDVVKMTRKESSPLTTLSDFMDWREEQDPETRNSGKLEDTLHPVEKMLKKPAENTVPKKFSYLESLGGLRSPTISRH